MMPEFAELGERIRQIATQVGGNKTLSAKTGIPIRTLDNYISGQNDVKTAALVAISRAGDISLSWLATGEGNPQKTYGFSSPEQERYAPEGHSLTPVPILNISASAGHGSVVLSEKTSGFIGFSREWLHQQGLSPADLFSMPTMGESMEPTIKAGEYVLCSKAEHHLKPGDGIFVVRLEGDILVKRLQRLPGGILQVSSDNAAFYKPFNIDINDGTDFLILGKVVIVHGARRV